MNRNLTVIVLVSIGLLVYGCGKKEEKPPEAKVTTAQPAKEAKLQETGSKTPAIPQMPSGTKFVSMGIAPSFELPNLEGNLLRSSDLEGKVYIVDFWATWCPPCRKMVPELKKVYDKYKGSNFEIIAISLDEGGADTVKSFVESTGINYTILLADKDITKKFGQINAIPTSFIIDKQGNIRDKHIGFRSAEDMENIIKELLSERM
ncbi:MAG: TlpA disulfide reductase family protein [Candidatus Auribacterota bacterium]|jgi:thiol-disulfide isomerase/thioredoxin|nr:TlpA disulfide reductase family protein [Candidatus Auribacterota bacterium]